MDIFKSGVHVLFVTLITVDKPYNFMITSGFKASSDRAQKSEAHILHGYFGYSGCTIEFDGYKWLHVVTRCLQIGHNKFGFDILRVTLVTVVTPYSFMVTRVFALDKKSEADILPGFSFYSGHITYLSEADILPGFSFYSGHITYFSVADILPGFLFYSGHITYFDGYN